MKKRWLPFLLVALLATFLTGLRLGSQAEATHQAETSAVEAPTIPTTTIAVVNADTGALISGTRYNYSQAIINTLSENFVLVSPAMAQSGLVSGIYSAVITFPSDVSTRILSFNAHEPERIQLEFQINPNLPEREFLETYITITELQMAINTTLASTYVSSIFRQFHEAQDQIYGVFRNTLSDLMALESISLGDFTTHLNLDEIPFIQLNPTPLDTYFYLDQVASFAQEVSSWYRNSYAMASDQFLWMREGLFMLTENFPEQENDWLNMLSLWTGYSEEYGRLLEEYAAYVLAHEEALTAWHAENAAWHEALEDYQHQVSIWHDDSNMWFQDAEHWHTEYLGFLDEAMDYHEALREFHIELEESLTPLQEDITDWKDTLLEYEVMLNERLDSFTEMVDVYNEQAEESNQFLEELLTWHEEIDDYLYNLYQWKEDVTYRLEEINTRQEEVYDITAELQQILDSLTEDFITLSPMPPALEYMYIPGLNLPSVNIPSAPESLQLISIWQRSYVSTSPVYIPYIPVFSPLTTPEITIPTIPCPSTSNPSYQELYDWQNQLHQAAGELQHQQSQLQAIAGASEYLHHAANELYARDYYIRNIHFNSLQAQIERIAAYVNMLLSYRRALGETYLELRDWHQDLLEVEYQLITWESDLRSYALDMDNWYQEVELFIEELYATHLPLIPEYLEWEHIELPDEVEAPAPELVEPLEHIVLPNWQETLPAPQPYDGKQIIEAFSRQLPLLGNAFEPLYLERPVVFTDYNRPERVHYHGMLLAQQPLSPLRTPPPRPEDFWASLDFMHSQLSSFDVGAFLSDDILRMVDQSLHSYDQFLQFLRDEIAFLFMENIWLMYDIHAEYDFFLRNLQSETFSRYFDEHDNLREAIEYFATAREDTHADTWQRLGTFTQMMPESRGVAGVNQELVDFTVMPFDFVPLSLREPLPVQVTEEQPLAETFQRFQMLVLITLGGVFLGTAVSSLVSYYNRKKREEAEARGYM